MSFRAIRRMVIGLCCLALLLAACEAPQPFGDAPLTPLAELEAPEALPTIPLTDQEPEPLPTHTPSGPPMPRTDAFVPRQEWASLANHGASYALAGHSDGSIWGVTEAGVVRWDLDTREVIAFGSPDGLASQAVNVLWIAPDDQVWVGTEAGLSRYDGAAWATFAQEDGLPASQVLSLVEASDEALWVGTEAGLARFDGERWETIWVAPEGELGAIVAALEGRDGVLWFAVQGDGLLRHDEDALTHLSVADGGPSSPTRFLEDAAGALWVGTYEDGLWRYVDGVWSVFTAAQGLPDGPVTALAEGLEGSLWVGTLSGVVHFDGVSWTSAPDEAGLMQTAVHDLALGLDGNMWAATDRGVFQHNGSGWEHMEGSTAMPDAPAYAFLPDQNRGLLVGTALGLALYAGDTWTVYPQPEGPASHQALDIVQTAEGALWLATEDAGLLVFDGESWEVISPWGEAAAREDEPVVSRLFDLGDDSLWVSGADGVGQLDLATRQLIYRSRCLPEGLLRPLLQTQDGTLWFAVQNGLAAYREDEGWSVTPLAEDLDSTVLVMLETSGGALWVGTDGQGLFRHNGDPAASFAPVANLQDAHVRALVEGPVGDLWAATSEGLGRWDGPRWSLWTAASGLEDVDVHALLLEEDGTLWVGTAGGLGRYDGEQWAWYTTADGLPSDTVTALAWGPDGALWVAMDQGIARLDGAEWTPIASKAARSATAADDGSLWFGTPDGLVRYDGLSGYELSVDGLDDIAVGALLQDAWGALWAETDEGVAWYVDGFWATRTQCGPGREGALSMLYDQAGDLWTLAPKGIYRHSQGQWQGWHQEDGLSLEAPLSLWEDQQGRIWYVAADGVAMFAEDTWSLLPVESDEDEAPTITGIAETDDGRLWLAMGTGLYRLDGDQWLPAGPTGTSGAGWQLAPAPGGVLWAATEERLLRYSDARWTVFEPGAELPDAPLGPMLVATDGTMWISVEGHGLWHHNVRGWTSITSLHGLASNTVTHLYEAQDGALWIVTSHGLSRYTPAP